LLSYLCCTVITVIVGEMQFVITPIIVHVYDLDTLGLLGGTDIACLNGVNANNRSERFAWLCRV